MKITIFGATGKTGRHLLEQALDADHEVTVFVRDRKKLHVDPERMRVVEGDVHDIEAVRRAIAGSDAVLSVVGHTKSSQGDILEAAAKNYVEAMKAEGVGRVVTLLGAGVAHENDHSSLGRKFMLGLMGLVAKTMLVDAQAHAEMLRASGLKWTIVRPPRLTDDEPTGRWEAGYLKLGPANKMSRADLAAFMLEQMESEEFVEEAPMVSNV